MAETITTIRCPECGERVTVAVDVKAREVFDTDSSCAADCDLRRRIDRGELDALVDWDAVDAEVSASRIDATYERIKNQQDAR
jgi:hypothetical protein